MEKFISVNSKAAPLMLANIDTDIISPMRRLVKFSGIDLAPYAFEALRYVDGDADKSNGQPNPDFVLNQPAFKNAQILITGENFGCGSSRETAVTAIAGLGIRCLIGSGFGEIFYKNCLQNSILPIILPLERVTELADEALATATTEQMFRVDLQSCTITTASGDTVVFELNPVRREALLEGLDGIGVTLKRSAEIAVYQTKDRLTRPWVWSPGR